MTRIIISLFLIWRLFLLLPIIIAQNFLNFRAGFDYTRITYFLNDKTNILANFLLYPFANFDGIYYLLIAAKGYTVNAGFFPLFPFSIHIATLPFNVLPFNSIQYFLAIFLVSIYFLAALIIFYKLIKLDYKKILLFGVLFFY